MNNILFVSHSAELNGAELWLLETLRLLDRRKYTPFLVVPKPGPFAESAARLGIAVEIVPMKWSLSEKRRVWRQPLAWAWNAKSVKRITSLIRRDKIDLVFTNSAAMFSGAQAAIKAGIPHIWAIHELLGGANPHLHFLFGRRALARHILKSSASVIVNSEASRMAFPADSPVVIVYNGLEMPSGEENRQKTLRGELGIQEGDLVAAVIGKIYRGKGQAEALRAASLLGPKYPNLKWLIIGAVGDGRYARDLGRYVQAAGLSGKVFFLGHRLDLSHILGSLNIVVIPSVVESFGRAALEAMAAGVPVVGVREGGLPEIIVHGDNGLLADSNRPEEMARAVAFVLDNPGRAKAMAEEGKRPVRATFTLENQIRGIEKALDACLG
jgi:glycosyltransferase involved in cell wall biosynthesis